LILGFARLIFGTETTEFLTAAPCASRCINRSFHNKETQYALDILILDVGQRKY
jgi:hypothetical protein